MACYSRRTFLAGAGAIPFAVWFEGCRHDRVHTRGEAYTSAGQAMLVTYASAVGKMKTSIAEGDPKSWLFQWYTHAVRPDRTKASEITRLYPGTSPNPVRDLAQQAWDTCEPHFSGVEENFVPWHRMFVYFFERIIRKVSGDPDFALPYWNYSTTGPNLGIVPPEFRVTSSPLYQANRNPGVNSGVAIGTASDLNLGALAQTSYLPSGAAQGFNQDLDLGLHGNVHVLTGDFTNMGSIPWAAEDAVFYMHHCNIDRLWASWNKNGGLNPTNQASWMNTQFTFADENGVKVVGTIKDFTDIARLYYTYDSFEPAPAGFVPSPLAAIAPLFTAQLASDITPVAHAVALGGAGARVVLRPANAQPANRFSLRMKNLAAGRKIYLVLKGLQATAQPGVLYDIYLNLPEAAPPNTRNNYQIGSINFFAVTAHGGHASSSSGFRSFDVTSNVRNQGTSQFADNPVVSIIPRGAPAKDAGTVIGDIALVEQ